MGQGSRIRTRAVGAFVAVLVVVLGIGGAAVATPQEGSGPATLTGTVFDGSSIPTVGVDGVTVCLNEADGAICKLTGTGGGYTFSGVATGDYTLSATPPPGTDYLPIGGTGEAYMPIAPVPVTLHAGSQTQDLELFLGGRLALTVTGANGLPAPGEPISLCQTDDPTATYACPNLVPLATVDGNGQLTTGVLPIGLYDLSVGYDNSPYGFPVSLTDLEVLPQETTPVPVQLVAGGSLSGYVRNAANQPIVGAQVSIAIPPNIGTSNATTDVDGRYSFASLKPGTYEGTVYPPAGGQYGSTATGSITITSGGATSADFSLLLMPAPGTVVLTIDEPLGSGSYYPGFCADDGLPMLRSPVCDDGRPATILFGVPAGATRTQSLPAGDYNAAMADPALTTVSPIKSVTVVSGTTTFCSFTMAAGPVCTVDDGDGIQEPPPGFPADYSGNGDTIPDADQPNVTSLLPAVGSAPVTIASPDGTTLSGVTASPVPASPAPPGGATFPVGILGFSVHLASGDTTADVEIHLPAGTNPSGYYKLVGGAWVAVPATIVGDVVTLHLADGDQFDTDPTVGVIGDPGGPVVDAFQLRGFVSPSPGTVAKAGSTVPVKWRITNGGGVALTDPASFVSLASAPCAGGPATAVSSPGASGLQLLDDGTWQLNWKTTKSMAGQCRTLTLTLADGLGSASVDVRLR